MENTVRPGDALLAADGRDVRRGDLVALDLPPGRSGTGTDEVFIRRVIGLPGDNVTCCAGGHVAVDGKPLDETYVYPGDQPSATAFSVILRPGQLWVLGDHRSVAIDSRTWGAVPARDVAGRVVAVRTGGTGFQFVRTPRAFTAAGLAPPDRRAPWVVVPLFLAFAAALMLVILISFGVIRTLMRRRRRARLADAAGPSSS